MVQSDPLCPLSESVHEPKNRSCQRQRQSSERVPFEIRPAVELFYHRVLLKPKIRLWNEALFFANACLNYLVAGLLYDLLEPRLIGILSVKLLSELPQVVDFIPPRRSDRHAFLSKF